MTEKLHDPSELSHEDLVAVLRKVQDILWPNGDRDHEWDADTPDEIADTLIDAGIGPNYS